MSRRKSLRRSEMLASICLPALLVLAPPAVSQDQSAGACAGFQASKEGFLLSTAPTGLTIGDIVQKLAQRELQFKLARQAYSYSAQLVVQTLTGDKVDGELRAEGQFSFDDGGQRSSRVSKTADTVKRVRIPVSDVDPYEFLLTPENAGDYDFIYVGQQQAGDRNTFVVDVKPKRLEPNRAYLEGRIWVLESDFSVIKIHGKTVSDNPGRHDPKGTEWRELVDARHWFPACGVADDVLSMRSGKVHMRQMAQYTNYVRGRANVPPPPASASQEKPQ